MSDRDSQLPRVCFLLEWFYPTVGGIEVHSGTLAEKLLENGIKVFVATRRLSAQLAKRDQVRGIPIYRIPPKGNGYLKKWLMIIPALAFLIRMRKEYDIIYVPFFRTLGIPAVVVSRIFHKGCVLREAVQGEMSGETLDQGLQKVKLTCSALPVKLFLRLRNWLFKQADVFVSISSDVTMEYMEYGIGPRKIRLIPHGVDTERFHPISPNEKRCLRQKLGLNQNKTIVTFVGRLVSYKGLALLLQVWKELTSKRIDTCLVLVGSGKGGAAYDCESELRELVKTQALEDNVYFTGKVGNVQEYLQASDVFVFPSERDTFAIALIEAMSCGLPVIVMPQGGPKEIVTNGKNGIYAADVHEFYEAFDILFCDTSLAASLGRAARKTILEKYGLTRMVKEYIDVFCSLKKSMSMRKTGSRYHLY